MFTIVAGAVGIALLNNLVYDRGNTLFLETSQKRLEQLRGNSASNFNFVPTLIQHQAIFNPRGGYRATKTFSKVVEARTNSWSWSKYRKAKGNRDIIKYNYIRYGGAGATGPSQRLYSKYG